MGDTLPSRLRKGRHRRAGGRGGRGARYAVGGLALAAGAFEVAYLIAGASVSGGGIDTGGLGAAEAPSRPPGGGSRGVRPPGEAGGPASGGARPGVRPSATSLLLTSTSPLPTAAVTPLSPLAPAATAAPESPGTHGPRTRPRPPSGPGGRDSRPTDAPTAAPGASPGTHRPAEPPGSPPSQDGSGSGPGLCVPVIGLCVDPLGGRSAGGW